MAVAVADRLAGLVARGAVAGTRQLRAALELLVRAATVALAAALPLLVVVVVVVPGKRVRTERQQQEGKAAMDSPTASQELQLPMPVVAAVLLRVAEVQPPALVVLAAGAQAAVLGLR